MSIYYVHTEGEMENTHACSTIIDDSEITEVNNETFDVIDMV